MPKSISLNTQKTPRKLIVCCDGTGNEIKQNQSNVLKFYHMMTNRSALMMWESVRLLAQVIGVIFLSKPKVYSVPFITANSSIKKIHHAMAIDECRRIYLLVPW